KRGDPTRVVNLASGDAVVLGGEARLAFHGVDRIMPGTSRLLPQGGRINLTLRRGHQARAPAQGSRSSPSPPPNSSPTGVLQAIPAPPGSLIMAMRPTSGTSNGSRITCAPAAFATLSRASTSSTARYDIQLSGTPSNSGPLSGKMPATGLSPIVATQ